MLGLVVGLPAVFATVEQQEPTLPRVYGSEVADDHSGLLNARLMHALVTATLRLGLGAALLLLFALIGRWVLALRGNAEEGLYLRLGIVTALLAGAASATGYALWIARRKAVMATDELAAVGDDPEKLQPARNRFVAAHRELTLTLQAVLAVLLGMVLFGG